MSSGFVSAGTTDNPVERDDEWLQAQQDIEANRRRKEEESRQDGGKTLFEVLQSNKAAKQDAFEESIRLKNQFRNLDEDEVEFLDSVLESTRNKEAEVKKQTSEQLDLFRKQQEEADKIAVDGSGEVDEGESRKDEEEKWAVSKGKRKRVEEKKALKGLKFRKSSSSSRNGGDTEGVEKSPISLTHTNLPPSKKTTVPTITTPAPTLQPEPVQSPEPATTPVKIASQRLGLAGYSSDEED